MGLNVVDDVSPPENKGIFTVVEIACSNGRDLKTYQKAFWLPKTLVKAVLLLRDAIHMNRLDSIPDEKCAKAITFKIRNAEPTLAFLKIVKVLSETGAIVKIENAPKAVAEELRKLNINVEVV